MKILIAIASLFLIACVDQAGERVKSGEERSLPLDATNIKHLGNGWVTFDWNGNHFLFRRSLYDRSASDCITVIPEGDYRLDAGLNLDVSGSEFSLWAVCSNTQAPRTAERCVAHFGCPQKTIGEPSLEGVPWQS